MAPLEFAGKVVLVTGSSSGIGETTAIEFAKLGARVVITGRNSERLKLVEEKCQAAASKAGTAAAAGKKSVLAIAADVAKDEDLKTLVNSTIKEFGQLDVLVNNAGMPGYSFISDPNSLSVYDQIMKTNLRSIFVLTHLAIPHLIKSKGNIVNVSSVLATRPRTESSVYCMSKAGLDMFTKCLALEVGPLGVRVNSVNPGIIKTPIFSLVTTDDNVDGFFKYQYENAPLRKVGEPEDIAYTITFLASSKAVNMTGSLVVNDSGSLWGSWPTIPTPQFGQ